MTAINTIIQKRARCVHVLSDGAVYTPEGKLACQMQKVHALAHLNAVAVSRGMPLFAPMFALHANVRATGFDDLKRRAADIAREEISKTMTMEAATHEFELIIAGISETSGPSAYALWNHSRAGAPYRVVELGEVNGLSLSPYDISIEAELKSIWPDGVTADCFDPVTDGLRVVEIQRRHPTSQAWKGRPAQAQVGIGCFVQLTTVTGDAIATRILRRWPDEIRQPLGGMVAKSCSRCRSNSLHPSMI